MKCQWKYPNKGGCGKTATFHIQRPGRLMDTCHSHLPPAVKLLVKDAKQGYVEVEPIVDST